VYKFRSLLSWLKGRGGEVVTIELPTKALRRKFMQKGGDAMEFYTLHHGPLQ